jgi:spermidine/putrescine transport system ATP-binding protein
VIGLRRSDAEPSAGEASVQAAARGVAVALVGLERRFQDITAVRGIDLIIHDNEFFSLIGPSGCGKTTTLRMIAGLEVPSEGQVYVNERDVTSVPAHKRPVNTVFQHYALFPHLNVFDNVAYGLRERRLKRPEIRRRVAEMLELVDLSGRELARPRELSGGQQQRVALARALVLEPEVLLLDEPLGALDLKLRKQMQVLLKRVRREVGITFLYVTHDQEEAFSMSDRVGIMNSGVLEQVGNPREVYERPRTLFVANFVGGSNRFPGRVRAALAAERYQATILGFGDIELRGPEGQEAGADAVAIVRPESIVINPTDEGMVGVDGRILDMSYLGPHVLYTVDAGPLGILNVLASSRSHGADSQPNAHGRFGWTQSSMWLVPA